MQPHKQAVRRPATAPRTPPPARATVRVPGPLQWMSPAVYARLREYALLTRQDRPVGWLLLLWPTCWALWIAAAGMPPAGTLVIFVLGVIVMRSAGCVVNDWADRWLDPQVERTRSRPLASGRVSPGEALLLLLVLLALALGLVLLTNEKTLYLSGGALVLAVIYPFMKRHTWWPQVWLGAAFGMSVPMAFTAVTDAWPPPLAWLLFVANVLWATAYDTLYAMVDREDDLRAGARSTAILFGDLDLVAVGVLTAVFLLAMWLAGERAELGLYYRGAFGVAVMLAAALLWWARDRSRPRCFAAFRHNHWIGAVLFAGIALDYALR